MVGVLVLYGGLVLMWMLCVPVFGTWDEAANVDYSLQLSHGRLPLANSDYDAAFPQLGQNARGQYVSNHGPLFHALVAPFVRLAEGSEHARAFLLLARGTSALFGGLAILVVGLTARALLARSPRSAALAMVVAAAAVATVPEVVAASGAHRNDVLTALLTAITMFVLVNAARSGLRTGAALLVAVVCALGMLSRVSFLPVWLLAVGGVAVLALWPGLRLRRPGRRDVRRGAALTAAVTVVPLLVAGWFYALNLRRYGDLTGGSALYPRVERRKYAPGAEDGPVAYLLNPTTWWTQLQQLGGIRSTVQPDDHVIHTVLASIVAALLVAATIATASRILARRPPLLDRIGRWQLLALAVLGLAILAELAHHVANKGAENQRYLVNAIPFWGSGVALLLLGFRRRLVPYASALLTAVLTVGAVVYTVERIQDLEIRGDSWFGTLVAGLEHSGVPAAALVVTVLLLTVATGFLLQLAALLRISVLPNPPEDRVDSCDPVPTDAPAGHRASGSRHRAGGPRADPAADA